MRRLFQFIWVNLLFRGIIMDITTAVRYRILELRQQKGITVINKLGTICGITQSTLKNIASGRNGATVLTLKKICDGLEIDIIEFFNSDLFKNLEPEIK